MSHHRRGPQLRPGPSASLPGQYGSRRGFFEAPEHPQPFEPTEYHVPIKVLRAVEELAPRRRWPTTYDGTYPPFENVDGGSQR